MNVTTRFVGSLFGQDVLTGLTVVNNTLYVTMEYSEVIESYELCVSDTLPKIGSRAKFSVAGLLNPRDIKGTKRDCLYIFDKKFYAQPAEIFIFDLNLKAIQKRWSTGDNYGSLSITDEGNVILTVENRNTLMEYTSDGQLIREITLSSAICNPLHSLKLSSGHFVVSNISNSRICIVDENGDVLRAFGEENKSWLEELYVPLCLAIDSSGSIIVADQINGRVLLLTSTLEFKDELVSAKNGLCSPTQIHLDESNGARLFVVDRDLIHFVKFGKCKCLYFL